jgi:hypothetical protein
MIIVAVQAVRCRCPKCNKLLGGDLLSMIRDEHKHSKRTYGCVFCKTRWKRESAL